MMIRDASASASASPWSPQVKFNSTSSLYIDSTITKPCTDEMIFSVSVDMVAAGSTGMLGAALLLRGAGVPLPGPPYDDAAEF